MSLDRCDKCSRAIDTDFDAECYDADDTPVCQSCRKVERDREYYETIEVAL